MVTSTYVSLATITLATTDSEIIFSSIPATFRDLIVVCESVPTVANKNLLLRMNSDTGTNYSVVFMFGRASNDRGSASGTDNKMQLDSRANSEGTTAHTHRLQIMDYSATDKHKTLLIRSDRGNEATEAFAGRYASNSAATSIQLFYDGASIKVGSTFSLYGIA